MDYRDSQYTRHKRTQTTQDDDRITLRRLANGLCFAASLILLYVFLAPIF
jgi:hypothetical protein